MRPALLLVDLQRDFLERAGLQPAPGELTARCASLLSVCRERGRPVLHAHTLVRPDGSDRMPHWKSAGYWACVAGTTGAAPPVALQPLAGEAVFGKQFFSAFGNPDLDRTLRGLGVDTLIIAGVYLHGCVRSTAFDAYERGYDVWIAEDCVASTESDHAEITRRYLQGRAATFLSAETIASRLDGAAGAPSPDAQLPGSREGASLAGRARIDRSLQETLTRVGPGTPMGALLRRYWHPVAASCELASGSARAVGLLCETFVLFRTTDGRLGMVDERCTHRGTSLRCGHVDALGITCPYHGWKFAPSGECLAMPAEASAPRLLAKARTRGYPVEELGGLIFAYIGPAPAPLLPRYDLYVWDGVLRDVGQALIPCNWLQIMENSVDPTHIEWLHGHHLAAVRERRGVATPTHYRRHHARIGFDLFEYGIVKRRVLEGHDEEDDDWKIGHPLIFPTTLRVGTQGQHRFQIRVPVDDTHTRHYWYSCYRPAPGVSAPVQAHVPLYEVPWRDADGEFIVDFVDGGDIMTWVSQGAIADRTKELLVASDRGIPLLRQLYLEQIERVRRGDDPLGVLRDPARNRIIEFAQERDKFRGGAAFLREAIEISHVRYSPLKEQIVALLGLASEDEPR